MMDGFSEEKFNFQCGNGGKEFLETQAIDDDDDIIYLGEVVHSEEQEEPRSDALEILEYLASENDATINFEVTEHDTGELSLPLYFKCKLQAGSYNVETESPYSRMAKLMAAEVCLDQMQKDHPTMRLPAWKKSAPLDPKLDPVLILKQFCRDNHLSAPCQSYSSSKNEDNGEAEYLYKYYWESTYTEGRNKSKSVAQRLAAFEMLDYILNIGMRETKTSTVVVDDHISLSPEVVKRIEDGQLKQECIPRTPQSFQTLSQPSSGPCDPSVKIRHGFSPQATGVKERLRFYTEFEASFVAKGTTDDEALQKCLTAAVSKAQEYGSQFERTVQPRHTRV